MNYDFITERLSRVPGDVGIYYKDLISGESFGLRDEDLFESASVIKLPIYASIMKLCSEGNADLSEVLVCQEEDKMPSCGALPFFGEKIEVSVRTLCGLMITISDNTATNLLIRRFGIDELNEQFKQIGMEKSHIERLLFDAEGSARGLENRISPKEMGELLEKIWSHSFISESVSIEMEELLLKQQINHKIPGYLDSRIQVAHKTGEDDGITNDVAIVYTERPFVLCFASNHTDVPEAERAIREISLQLAQMHS